MATVTLCDDPSAGTDDLCGISKTVADRPAVGSATAVDMLRAIGAGAMASMGAAPTGGGIAASMSSMSAADSSRIALGAARIMRWRIALNCIGCCGGASVRRQGDGFVASPPIAGCAVDRASWTLVQSSPVLCRTSP